MKVMLIDSPSDPVRLAYLHVFDKRPGMRNADGSKSPDKFEVNPIFSPDGDNAARVRAAIEAVAKEKYGEKPVNASDKDGKTTGQIPAWQAVLTDFGEDQRGLRIGNQKKTKDGEIADGFADMVYVSAKNTVRPTVVNRNRTPLIGEDGVIYSGCYGSVQIDVWALNKLGVKKRIVTDLLGVQFSRDGDAFSAGARPADPDDFADLDAGDDSGLD